MRLPTLVLASLVVMSLTTSSYAVSDAGAPEGVTGNTYSGNIDFGPGVPGTGPSCILFRAGGDFTFQNPVGVFGGTYSEFDLFLFSVWNGTSTVGSAYSGFSLLTFLNFYTITTSTGQVGTSLSFIGGTCPSAPGDAETPSTDEAGLS